MSILADCDLDFRDDDAAVELLRRGQAQAGELFVAYAQMVARAVPLAPRLRLAERITTLLLAHDRLETELFYPAAQRVGLNDALLDTALDDHARLRVAIGRLGAHLRSGADCDSRVARLGRLLGEHAEFEDEVLYPALRRLGGIGWQATTLMRRQRELLAEVDAPVASLSA